MGDCSTFDAVLLNDIMDLHMLSLGASVPQGSGRVFYATRHQVYWGLTQCGLLLVLSFDITHRDTHTHTRARARTQKHTSHTGANRPTQPDKYKLTPPVMCSEQLSVLHFIISWYQKCFLQSSAVSLLFRSYSLSFSREIQSILIEMV